jgi:hypothetical protein
MVHRTQLAPRKDRWKWRKELHDGRARLFLVDPAGTAWEFKLVPSGAWIRRMR